MSDTARGPDWWQASDGKWYPPAPKAPTRSTSAGTNGPPHASGGGGVEQWLRRLNDRRKRWPIWGQIAFWVFLPFVGVAAWGATRPDGQRTWWYAGAAALLALYGVAVVTSGEEPTASTEEAATVTTLAQVPTTASEPEPTTTTRVALAAPETTVAPPPITAPAPTTTADPFAGLSAEERAQVDSFFDPPPAPVAPVAPQQPAPGCDANYTPCVPAFPPDVNCGDLAFPVQVIGGDPHGLDSDGDGRGCESN